MLATKVKQLTIKEDTLDREEWIKLNTLWETVHLGTQEEAKKQLAEVIESSKGDGKHKRDPRMTKCLLKIGQEMKSSVGKDKLLWSTSKYGEMMYPPIDIEDASPIPWNDDESFFLNLGNSTRLIKKYPDFAPLMVDEHINSIEQNPDISNCSLIATLINLSKYGKENFPEIRKIVDNRYHINLHFNGCGNRLITVDCNNIPYNRETGEQLSLYSNNLRDKILELAYLQLHGNTYKSSGSNVAVDTYRLTGFLPEIGTVTKYSFDKLKSFFDSKLCLMAIGTGNDESKLRSPFLKNHDYSVIKFDDIKRELFIQDPLDSTKLIRVKEEEIGDQFSQIYINWDSKKLFKNENTLTFYYNVDKFNKFESNFDKPIFTVQNDSLRDETVWILLETHLTPEYFKETSIAYLRSLPNDISETMFIPIKSASNIGLQLIKWDIPAGTDKKFFCYSNLSKCFTIHYYSIGDGIKIYNVNQNEYYQSIEFISLNKEMNKNYGHLQYFTNPIFQINCSLEGNNDEILLNLQLLSRNGNIPINFQIFDKDDIYLIKPILFDNYYHSQHYERSNIPIQTNHDYLVICSCSSDIMDQMNEYKLIGSVINNKSNERNINFNKLLKVKRIDRTYGELLYHQDIKFSFQENRTRMKFNLMNKCLETKNNKLFIRLVLANTIDQLSNNNNDNNKGGINDKLRVISSEEELNLKFRINIYDSSTLRALFYNDEFNHNGVIIPEFKFNENDNPIILIEIDELKIDSFINMKLYIGSKNEIVLEPIEKEK